MIPVVIAARRNGSVPLVRTVDSVARQTVPTSLYLAVSTDSPRPVLSSLVARLGAAIVSADCDAAAIRAAIQRTNTDCVVVVEVPWRLDPTFVERSTSVLASQPEVDVVVPALRLQSHDGHLVQRVESAATLPDLLASPLATPPVFTLRRQLWERVGGIDGRFGALAAGEWWLRLFAASTLIARIDEPLACLIAGLRTWWPPIGAEPLDVVEFRAMLETHREFLARHVQSLVVEQEAAFAELVRTHRDRLRRRDVQLAELDRLRAQAAHHRAYLEHHGHAALDWGDLRRADPISRNWGYDRGTPIDRHYIEDFLASCSSDVAGDVLEVQESDFTKRFGGSRVTRREVLDLDDGNPRATIVTDLRNAAGVGSEQFDCIILTQTLHVIDDMWAALRECHRLLEPGGVLLATLPCASRVCLEYGEGGDLWRLTEAGARALFEPIFGPTNVATRSYGSVLTNLAFQHGLACDELSADEFASHDAYHPLLVGVRARKSRPSGRPVGSRETDGVVLLYHRVADSQDVHDLAVSPAAFAAQLEWLAANCCVMPLEELLAKAREGLPDRALALTFDDGYLDTLECAAPMLQRAGLPATAFATTRWLEERGEYWWDVLERALLMTETPALLTVDAVSYSCRTPEERRAAHDALHRHLVHASLDNRDRLIAEIGAWAGVQRDDRRRPVAADELHRLARMPGIDIGAHTVNHLALPDQSAAIQAREMEDAARTLERIVGRPVRSFAFPYGAVDRESAETSRRHYQWAMTCEPVPVPASFDAARVPRVEVKRWDIGTFGDRIERMFRPRPGLVPASSAP
jgi:peptidoglycan/xylan/chitin deacetylase (PgdA/CDA1 family)